MSKKSYKTIWICAETILNCMVVNGIIFFEESIVGAVKVRRNRFYCDDLFVLN